MITKESFQLYNDHTQRIVTEGRGYSCCFHCNGIIVSRYNCYSINRATDHASISLFFHEHCFREIAGMDYLLNDELSELLDK